MLTSSHTRRGATLAQGRLLFFDTARCEVVHERRLRMGMAVTSLTLSADERTMAVGYIDGTSEQLSVLDPLQTVSCTSQG